MRILLTNDDGFDAPGIQALKAIAAKLSDDVWVVAPETEQSGAAHSLSLRKPLHIRERGPKMYSVDGTPTDCVLLAIKEIMIKHRPDLVLSGVNRGSNLGEDITYSGTVAAAMEGTLLDVPSIALSQTIDPEGTPSWEVALAYAPQLIQGLYNGHIPPHTLMNVNFPAIHSSEVKGIKVTPQGKRKLGDNLYRENDPDGRVYYWISTMRNCEKDPPYSDFAAIKEGYISLTPVYLDLTHYAVLEKLDEHFTKTF